MLQGSRRSELITLCQRLIQIPSLSGNESDIARFIANSALSLGYDKIDVDSYGNVILHMRFNGPGKTLLFHSQMDHVTPGNYTEWSCYPYAGIIKDRRIWGRGSSDQKGALSAMIKSVAYLKEDCPTSLHGDVFIAAVVQQENFGGCSSRFIASALNPDAVVAGEASNLSIIRGQRGRAKIQLETRGRIAHSSFPELGINAAETMVSVISALKKNYVVPEDPFFGKGVLVLSGIYSTPLVADKAIPDCCSAFYERKTLLGEQKEQIVHQIMEAVTKSLSAEELRSLKASFAVTEGRCYTGAPLMIEQFVPAWQEPEDSEFLQTIARGLEKSGISAQIASTPGFGTSGCIYAGEQGLPTAIFGPGLQTQPHSVNEHIELAQLFSACEGYYHIAREFLTS
ncbi:M20/M25/M40 family metallo-hydrolase [Pyramidobacter sp.]|uniref:M20/M25/M40 family metallo-hydrolase n=1 Tax=Pyramidobacter sp. TaxID=1943581 RepID=UPI0025FC3D49|nr:M20/M25/M40 family metallo-hydrolase [Pyramidobacter sp.]MCI7403147.1 M20/M25/M40 family metallo-hydrolase [Pyramidobacter sp.]MDY3212137.1 M20/M25/M40 family metallo-hydrolase [Pyramidobacter sp.]